MSRVGPKPVVEWECGTAPSQPSAIILRDTLLDLLKDDHPEGLCSKVYDSFGMGYVMCIDRLSNP